MDRRSLGQHLVGSPLLMAIKDHQWIRGSCERMCGVRATQLTGAVAHHAEGPVWSDSWGGLRWVDMHAGDCLFLNSAGDVERQHVAEVLAALRPRRDGGAILAVGRGFAFEEPDGTVRHGIDLWSDRSVRMNDGGCDPDGRFYCGTMAYDARPEAAVLHRLDPDGSTRIVLDGVTISNGLEWSPDGSQCYYVDSPTQRVDVFDYLAGQLHSRRPFVEIPAECGMPDGLTVDAEGGVWVALYGGSAVRRYTSDGKLDEVVEVGARQVTACALGGSSLDQLYITTSRESLQAGDDAAAGALFRADVGVPGLPVRPFAG